MAEKTEKQRLYTLALESFDLEKLNTRVKYRAIVFNQKFA